MTFNLDKSLVLGAEAISESNSNRTSQAGRRCVPIFRKLITKTKSRSAFKLIGAELTSANIAHSTGRNITKRTCGSPSNTACKNRKYLVLESCDR